MLAVARVLWGDLDAARSRNNFLRWRIQRENEAAVAAEEVRLATAEMGEAPPDWWSE